MKALYQAKIYHKRFLPSVNKFNNSGFYINFTLNEMQSLNSTFFSVNKFNLFSFDERDHGFHDGTDLRIWAESILNKAGVLNFKGRIDLQTFPRVLGYVFNPVSFWRCFIGEELIAIICEVNNTFGESHNYVLLKNPATKVSFLNKHFHVSPFYDVKGEYQFDFRNPKRVNIKYYADSELQLMTSITGREVPFSDKSLIKLFFRYPFFTYFIVFYIHLQAMILFMKKNKFYTKPLKKENEVTYE